MGHEGGTLMNEISALMGTGHHVRTQGEDNSQASGRGASAEPTMLRLLASRTMDLRLLASSTMRNRLQLFIRTQSMVLCYSSRKRLTRALSHDLFLIFLEANV